MIFFGALLLSVVELRLAALLSLRLRLAALPFVARRSARPLFPSVIELRLSALLSAAKLPWSGAMRHPFTSVTPYGRRTAAFSLVVASRFAPLRRLCRLLSIFGPTCYGSKISLQ